MSSIIDALKKSDQNRNNENSSDLNNIKFSDNTPKKSNKKFILLVMVLLLVLVAVFAWTKGWHHKAFAMISSKEDVTVPVKSANNQVKANGSKGEIQPNNKRETINQLVPPKQSDIRKQSAEADRLKQNSQKRVEEIKKQTEQPLIKTESVSRDTNQAKNLNDAVKKEKTETGLITDTEINTEKTEDPLTPTLKQDYLLLHQIDFAVRKNIPQIKINIHIYDPEPENRMVLINGERFNIGDTIGDVLTVSDIVKEGIVLSFENLQFLIPK